tara:strand:- start:23 stop:1246 length:1224 start_codon:yes stop_codon:yes gene_type:complete
MTNYVNKKGEGSFLTFNKKILYKGKTREDTLDYANLVDFNFGEKFFYGKVQRNFVPMYFDNEVIKLKTINSSVTNGQYFTAMNFVADAFDKLAEQFQKGISSGQIYDNEEYLSQLKVFKAFTSPIAVYDQHLTNTTDALVQRLIQDDIEIRNFNDFLKHFKTFILKSTRDIPFTFSAFLKSKYCPMTVSGLVIEIADLDYFNDDVKVNLFYNNKNWKYFVNTCRSYGFMIDKNIPWRLVADISSQPMLEYATAYGLLNTDTILNTGFSRPEMFFLKDFRRYLLNTYNRIVNDEYVILKQCNNFITQNYFKTEKYTIDQIFNLLNDVELLKLYAEIRFSEDPKHFTEQKKHNIMKESLVILNSAGSARSLEVFEKIINQPFDYRGSVSYLYNQYQKGFGEKIVLSKPR